jgi:hypothetical protein
VASGQPAAGEPGPPARSLVLRLVVAGTEPITGSIGLEEQPAVRMHFSGWIGLMSAINELLAGTPGASSDPLVR